MLSQIVTHSKSFEIEKTAEYVNGIKVTKITAPSKDTTDITKQIEDINTEFKVPIVFDPLRCPWTAI